MARDNTAQLLAAIGSGQPRQARISAQHRSTIRIGAVFDEVLPVMNITPATHQPADTLPEQPARRLRVLVAEDHPLNQRLFALILSERGHDHVVVSNGKEVLQMLEQQSFDVILMDVQMPEMDGYQTTAEIRRRELATGAHTCIIAMTALALQQDRDLSLAAGMDDYVSKPVDRLDLLRRIETAPLAADRADAPPEPPI